MILILGGAGRLYGGLIGAIVYMVARDQFSGINPQYCGGPWAKLLAWLQCKLVWNPSADADKLTLLALEATLRHYVDPQDALVSIPALSMLAASTDELANRGVPLTQAPR